LIERDMEDLIAGFPDDFFHGFGFRLVGRQRSFAGVGRFDLLFIDRFDSRILMELKARPLRYEDATQVAGYKDELARQGEKNIVMWLVGTQVPSSVREFLDRIGIQYREIHEGEYRLVAERRGLAISSEVQASANRAVPFGASSPGEANPGARPDRRKTEEPPSAHRSTERKGDPPSAVAKMTKRQVGEFAKELVKQEFQKHGFEIDCDSPEQKAFNFTARRGGHTVEVQVRSLRKFGYVYVEKDRFTLRDQLYLAFVFFPEGHLPALFLIPSIVWKTPARPFVSRDYGPGLQSPPEWGMTISATNLQLLEPYRFDSSLRALL